MGHVPLRGATSVDVEASTRQSRLPIMKTLLFVGDRQHRALGPFPGTKRGDRWRPAWNLSGSAYRRWAGDDPRIRRHSSPVQATATAFALGISGLLSWHWPAGMATHNLGKGGRPRATHRFRRRFRVLTKARSGPSELAFFAAGYITYTFMRVVVEGSFERASANSARVLDLERALGLDWELGAQAWVLDRPGWMTFWNAIYQWLFWPAVGLTLVALWYADRDKYRMLRNSLLISAAIGLVVFALFPVSPPRFLDGYVDTLASRGDRLIAEQDAFLNLYAAVPSFHVGWPALAGFVVASGSRRLIVWVLAFVPAVLLAGSVVFTGNHFVLDAVAGLLVVGVARLAAGRIPAPEVS